MGREHKLHSRKLFLLGSFPRGNRLPLLEDYSRRLQISHQHWVHPIISVLCPALRLCKENSLNLLRNVPFTHLPSTQYEPFPQKIDVHSVKRVRLEVITTRYNRVRSHEHWGNTVRGDKFRSVGSCRSAQVFLNNFGFSLR